MTHTQPRQAPAEPPYAAAPPSASPWAGFVVFAGVMMLVAGSFEIIDGIIALVRDEYYLVTANELVVSMDFTAWGWTHLILGVVAVAAGIGVLAGQMWARVVGIAVAALSALANMAFVAAYPIWSIMIIALDVLVIYALAVHGREVRP
jgi:hypothetical protein